MKKTFKTTFSLLMALVLALSLTATAFAQAAQPPPLTSSIRARIS